MASDEAITRTLRAAPPWTVTFSTFISCTSSSELKEDRFKTIHTLIAAQPRMGYEGSAPLEDNRLSILINAQAIAEPVEEGVGQLGEPHELAMGPAQAVAEQDEQACMTINTLVLLADGTYETVQNLTGRRVATTHGSTATVVRVHRFHVDKPSARVLLIQGNWITDNHFIRNPVAPRESARFGGTHGTGNAPDGPSAAEWVRADGLSSVVE